MIDKSASVSAQQTTYSGQFTFVQHQGDGRSKKGSYTKEKRAHVSGHYRQWRKQTGKPFVHVSFSTRKPPTLKPAPRAIAPPPKYRRLNGTPLATQHHDVRPGTRRNPKLCRPEQAVDILAIDDELPSDNTLDTSPSDKSFTTDSTVSTSTSTPSSDSPTASLCSVSVVSKGNSDPFDCYAVPITPTMNSLLSLFRDVTVPAIYGCNIGRESLTSFSAKRRWGKMVDALKDVCSAYAVFTYHAAVRARLSPDRDSIAALALYSAKSMAELRVKLANPTALKSETTKWQMSRLCEAALLTQDSESSGIHLNMLHLMLQGECARSYYDLDMLSTSICFDLKRASIFMTPTIFNVDGWIAKVVAEAEDSLFHALEGSGYERQVDFSTRTDPSMDQRLRTLVLLRRQNLAHRARTISDYTDDAKLVMDFYSLTVLQNSIIHGRFLNLYFNWHSHIEMSLLFSAYEHVQATIAVAMLYYSRNIHGEPRINGKDLFETNLLNLVHLRDMVLRYPANQSEYAHAKLWCLFVGAFAEQRGNRTPAPRIVEDFDDLVVGPEADEDDLHSYDAIEGHKYSPSVGWFNRRFARHALALNLFSWNQIRPILEGFVYMDSLKPRAEEWWPETLAAYL